MAHRSIVLLSLAALGCGAAAPDTPVAGVLGEARAAAIRDSVRTFMSALSADIARRGPIAWTSHFVAGPEFFMVNDGDLVFPSADSAGRMLKAFAPTVRAIELSWSGEVRIDALAPGLAMVAAPYHEVRTDTAGQRADERGFFTGLAEHRADRWQLRDAHWSTKAVPK